MKRTKFSDTEDRLFALAGQTLSLDLDGLIERIDRATAAGPFVDQEIYLVAGHKLSDIRRVATAAIELRRALEKMAEERGLLTTVMDKFDDVNLELKVG